MKPTSGGAAAMADGLDSSIAAMRAAIDGELARTRISLVSEGRSTVALPLIERLIAVIEQTGAGERVAFSLACDESATLPLASDDAAELLGPLVHDLAQHADRKGDVLIFVHHGHDLHERARNAAGQHVEGDQRADCHGAVEDIERAEPDDGDAEQLFEQACRRLGCG